MVVAQRQGQSGSAVLPVLRVLLWKQWAAMPMDGSGSKQGQSGSAVLPAVPHPQLCRGLLRRLPCTDAGGIEELHIVGRHEAHPQTVEQSGEQGVGPGAGSPPVRIK